MKINKVVRQTLWNNVFLYGYLRSTITKYIWHFTFFEIYLQITKQRENVQNKFMNGINVIKNGVLMLR